MSQIQSRRIIIPLFFSLYFLLGINIFPDYGIAWDEAAQRELGIVTYDYIQTKLNPDYQRIIERSWLPNHSGKNYGLWFTLTNFVIEKQLGWDGIEFTRQQFLQRHFTTFLIFFIGVIFFYKLMNRRFQNWKTALLGTSMLILMPRIFAHSFFNPKDIILLSMFSISIFTMIRFVERKSLKWAIFHALACGFVVNTRMPGLIIPVFTIGLFILDFLQKRKFKSDIRTWFSRSTTPRYVLLFGILALLFIIALSPAFWSNPSQNIQTSFQTMANFNWQGSMLFFGEKYYGGGTPWYYTLGWILVTTPIIYLLFFVIGFFVVLIRILKGLTKFQFFNNEKELIDFSLIGIFCGAILAVIIKESTLYDGWRQMYFLAIPLIGIAMTGFSSCNRQIYLAGSASLENGQNQPNKFGGYKVIISAILFFGMLHTTYNMAKNHPSQNVYFNAFAGKNLIERFEVDYWGVCYKKAWEELAAKYPNSCIYVKCMNYPCEESYRFIEEELKDHLVIRYGPQKAEIHLSNFRMSELTKYQKGHFPYQNEVYKLEIDGEKVIGAFRDADWNRWFREELECDVPTVNFK